MATRQETQKAKANKELAVDIASFLAREGMSKKELAVELGISPASLYNKLKNPDTFTLGEIRRLKWLMNLENVKWCYKLRTVI